MVTSEGIDRTTGHEVRFFSRIREYGILTTVST